MSVALRCSDSPAAQQWTCRAIGALLLLHFAAVCIVKTAQLIPADVWWMSHIALALAGIGLLLASRLLIGAALTAVALPHVVWLLDFLVAQMTGVPLLGITQYLDDAGWQTWLATAHHFYLVPLLLLIACRHRYRWESLLLAIVLAVIATLISRAALPEARNVNWAFATMPDANVAVLEHLNRLPAASYLAILLIGQVLFIMLPTALLLRRLTRNRESSFRNAQQTSPAAHDPAPDHALASLRSSRG